MVFNNKIQECPICYDTIECLPLECGHSFCEDCLSGTIKYYDVMNNDEFMCPYCRHEIKSIDNEGLDKQLKDLHLRISVRKEEENDLYGIMTYLIMCVYWFPDDPNIHNYPKKMRFYTYEELI